MFEDERRSATVEAVEPTSVVGVLGPDMRRLMSEHPQIATRLVIALGRRLRETNERLSRQSFQTVQSRVAVVLSELVEQEIARRQGRLRRARHRHPGRPRAARRLLARVRQPLPRGARARRRDLPGPRAPGRARPASARAVCLLRAHGGRGGRKRSGGVARPRELSAGGVVVRGGEVVVIVPTRRAADGSRVLALPKGHVDPGETPMQAAAREVREETGVVAEPVRELRRVALLVPPRRADDRKSVAFFLFDYVEGDTADHDDEVEEARWIGSAGGRTALSHAAEREIVQRARCAQLAQRP